VAQTDSFLPTDPNSGTGGVTITSINGVQLPPALLPAQASATPAGAVYSSTFGMFFEAVTVTNNSSSTIAGPVQILFAALPANVTLLNPTGNLSGTPYLSVPGVVSLGPGQSITVIVEFAGPSNATVTFTPLLYSGSILRVFSTCDLQFTGAATVADVQLMINEALGSAVTVSDVSGSGVVNVVDIQIEINAVLGLGCPTQ
jgi:hypothetical protein